MSLSINRKIFDRVKTAIAEAGRIIMLSWAEGRDSTPAESVNEIRELPLLGDCRTTACIGGLICYLATSQEIASRTDCGRGRQRSQSGDDSYAYCKKENRIFAHEKSHFPSVANLCRSSLRSRDL